MLGLEVFVSVALNDLARPWAGGTCDVFSGAVKKALSLFPLLHGKEEDVQRDYVA